MMKEIKRIQMERYPVFMDENKQYCSDIQITPINIRMSVILHINR